MFDVIITKMHIKRYFVLFVWLVDWFATQAFPTQMKTVLLSELLLLISIGGYLFGVGWDVQVWGIIQQFSSFSCMIRKRIYYLHDTHSTHFNIIQTCI